MKQSTEYKSMTQNEVYVHSSKALPSPTENIENQKQVGLICPNCGSGLEGRKCKLFCTRPGCGYLVTCSEW